MAAFAAEDAIIKGLTETWSAAQVLLIAGGGGLAVFVALARRSGQRVLDGALLHRAVVARGLCEFFAALLFVNALARAPLGLASAILQAAPVALVAVGALVLGEKVGPRRWGAVLAGFAGVLLIVRPWSDAFDPSLLLAVGATVALAGRDLSTRFVPRAVGTAALSVWGYGAMIPAGLVSLAFDPAFAPLGPRDLLPALALVGLGVVGYYAVTAAMRVGDVSAVAPFRYARLVFAAALGAIFFAERPDAAALTGFALIAAAGIYAALRERRAGKAPASAASAVRVSR